MGKKKTELPIVDKTFPLQKFDGKGGWTYVVLPGLAKKRKQEGWKKVKGTIDGCKISRFHLMSLGDGRFMLPIKADIRKKIGKEAGSRVHIILFPDYDKLHIPAEMIACLKDEPSAFAFFTSLSESEKKYYVQWIYTAKRQETKVTRMIRTVERLSKGLKMYVPNKESQIN